MSPAAGQPADEPTQTANHGFQLTPEWQAFFAVFDELEARWQAEEDAGTCPGWAERQAEPTESDLIDWVLASEAEPVDDSRSL